MAHRRLLQTDPARRFGDSALSDQRIKGFQQIEVDGADIHGTNEYHIINLFDT